MRGNARLDGDRAEGRCQDPTLEFAGLVSPIIESHSILLTCRALV